MPFSQGPRRTGATRIRTCCRFGLRGVGSLARIDTRTGAVSYVPLPGDRQPIMWRSTTAIMPSPDLWAPIRWSRFDPAEREWTLFDLRPAVPSRAISRSRTDGITSGDPLFRRPQGRDNDAAQRNRMSLRWKAHAIEDGGSSTGRGQFWHHHLPPLSSPTRVPITWTRNQVPRKRATPVLIGRIGMGSARANPGTDATLQLPACAGNKPTVDFLRQSIRI